MKITNVVLHQLAYPIRQPYRTGNSGWIRKRKATLFEIVTDSGLIGWGEGEVVPTRATLEAHVIGRCPFDHAHIRSAMQQSTRNPRIACGIEIALWDLMGKATSKPVFELLGGARRKTVVAYASGFFEKQGENHMESLITEAHYCQDHGFSGLKVRIGFGPNRDDRILAAVRKAVGYDVTIAADATLTYDVQTAFEVGHRLVAHDILWYEEPVPADDIDSYRLLREKLPIAIAGAEGRSGLASFREVIAPPAMDIIQPDISRAGGFSEVLRICDLAAHHRVCVIPHMFGSVVRLAATLQWLATIPEDPEGTRPCYLEMDVTDNGLRTDLSPTSYPLEDGIVTIPEEPGIGVEIDAEALDKYRRPS